MTKEEKQAARQVIGRRLFSLREEAGVSTYAMTKEYKIRFEAIKAIEDGSSSYTIDNFVLYCKAIGVDLDKLLSQ